MLGARRLLLALAAAELALRNECQVLCAGAALMLGSCAHVCASQGWVLPTLHTIFVKASHRRMGCASQLLRGFYRPEDRGVPRSRKVSGPRRGKGKDAAPAANASEAGAEGAGAGAGEGQGSTLLAPITLASPVDFCDKLGMEPPVSDDLILTMASIFTAQELRNIVLLHGGETVQRAAAKNKTLLEHMRTPKALKEAEANTPLRRIRSAAPPCPPRCLATLLLRCCYCLSIAHSVRGVGVAREGSEVEP